MNAVIEELIGAYADVRRWLARRMGNAEDAGDLAQESFARAYGAALDTRVKSPRALLFRIAQNLQIDEGRRRSRERRALQTLQAHEAHHAVSAERTVSGLRAVELVLRRVEALPHRRRDAFVLVRIHGCTHAEAAAHLGVSVAAIEKHVVRATLDCSEAFVAAGDG